MKKHIYLFLLIALAFASCERLMMPKPKKYSATQLFEEVWSKMNTGYAYFESKGIDWDSVHNEYMFKIADTFNTQQVYDTLSQMLNILQDDGISLNAGFAQSYYKKPTFYKEDFNKQLLEKTYWLGAERTGPMLYKVIDSCGYIYYGDFNQDITDAQINVVIDRLKGLGMKKGLILDVRNNPGGKYDNMFTLFKHMGYDTAGYDYSVYLYQSAYKKGPARDEFTDYVGTFMDKNNEKKFAKKIRVLTNRGMLGVGNLFATGSQGFFNVRTMGDTTGGGNCGLTTSYELSNSWVLTFPSTKVRTAGGFFMNDGVAPDSTIHTTATDEAAGKDTIIEAAIANLWGR